MMFNRYKRLSSFENALVFLFILGMTMVVFFYFKKYEEVIKMRAAQEQLYQINTAIVVYRVLNHKFPESLKVLVEEQYIVSAENPVIKKRYLEGISVDKEGFPLDPWGRRFGYDKKQGLAMLRDKE